MLAIMFMAISSYICGLCFMSGNKKWMSGFRALLSFLVRVVVCAIFMIPFHRHMVPKKVMDNSTALLAEEKIELLIASILPVKMA